MGSVIDGEDVVQDTLVRAFVALQDLEEAPPLRPWLFRIAHNRALDLLRSGEVRMAEPIDAAADVAGSAQPDPLEMLMRKEAVKTVVSRFVELPVCSSHCTPRSMGYRWSRPGSRVGRWSRCSKPR